eukprot:3941768-Rhodomonas_salina.1
MIETDKVHQLTFMFLVLIPCLVPAGIASAPDITQRMHDGMWLVKCISSSTVSVKCVSSSTVSVKCVSSSTVSVKYVSSSTVSVKCVSSRTASVPDNAKRKHGGGCDRRASRSTKLMSSSLDMRLLSLSALEKLDASWPPEYHSALSVPPRYARTR